MRFLKKFYTKTISNQDLDVIRDLFTMYIDMMDNINIRNSFHEIKLPVLRDDVINFYLIEMSHDMSKVFITIYSPYKIQEILEKFIKRLSKFEFRCKLNTNLNVIGRKITEIIKGRQIENSYTCKEYRLTITKQ